MSQCRQAGVPAPTNNRYSLKRRQQPRLRDALERARFRALLFDLPEVPVCPACISTAALFLAGLVSTGGVAALLARLKSKRKTKSFPAVNFKEEPWVKQRSNKQLCN